MSDYTLFLVKKIWHFRFSLGGFRRSGSTHETTRAKADKVASRIYQEARLRFRGLEPCPTLRECVDRWMAANQRRWSTSHAQSVERFCRLHAHGLADKPLNRITTEDVELAMHEHLGTHKPRSANQWISVLNLLANWAMRRGWLDEIPWRVKKLRVQRQPKPILPPAKTSAWLSAVDELSPDAGFACRLMLGLGLRESEALTARWEHVDWHRGTYTPWMTKGKEAVALVLPSWLLEFLRQRRQTEGWMIPFRGNPHRRGYCVRFMASANASVGTPGLTPHRLRGTCASLLAAFMPLPDLQRFMRHKDPKTTLVYIEEDPTQILRAHAAISEAQGLTSTEPQGSKE